MQSIIVKFALLADCDELEMSLLDIEINVDVSRTAATYKRLNRLATSITLEPLFIDVLAILSCIILTT